MLAEKDSLVEERFLMILGRLSKSMIGEMEEKMRPWRERLKQRREDALLAEWDRFDSRDKSTDQAFFALYAYADIPLKRRYDCIFRRNVSERAPVDCTIEYAVYEGFYPCLQVEHGHKHILFLSSRRTDLEDIPTYEKWEEVGRTDWIFGLCDLATFKKRKEK